MDGQVFAEVFEEDMLQYRQLFEGNREFVQEHLDEDPEYFQKLAKGQTPQYLIISCADSRVPPNDLTGLKPGDIFNHRNVANVVTLGGMNANSVIQYAVEQLRVKHVVVMGHTCCGGDIMKNKSLGIQASIDGTSFGGMLDLWLSHVKSVYDKYQVELDAITDMKAKVDRLSELNVLEQVVNVWKNPYIQKSWKKGHPVWVHGWIFRVETGLLEEIIVEQHMPSFLKVFQFKFDDDKVASKRGTVVIQPIQTDKSLSPKKQPTIRTQRSSIWQFDDYMEVQSALMMQEADQIINVQEQLQGSELQEEKKESSKNL